MSYPSPEDDEYLGSSRDVNAAVLAPVFRVLIIVALVGVVFWIA